MTIPCTGSNMVLVPLFYFVDVKGQINRIGTKLCCFLILHSRLNSDTVFRFRLYSFGCGGSLN